MLSSIGQDGTLFWTCVRCLKDNSCAVSHPEVEYTGSAIVALPFCACGARCFLKVSYTPEEWIAYRDENGELNGTGASAQLHTSLVPHLTTIGKLPPPPFPTT